jgi:hypothetical protein
MIGDRVGRGRTAGEDVRKRKEARWVKARRRNSSMSEKPVHSRLRRLVDWINLTGAKKVHSLIDKVYKRKNLEMAWEKVWAADKAANLARWKSSFRQLPEVRRIAYPMRAKVTTHVLLGRKSLGRPAR